MGRHAEARRALGVSSPQPTEPPPAYTLTESIPAPTAPLPKPAASSVDTSPTTAPLPARDQTPPRLRRRDHLCFILVRLIGWVAAAVVLGLTTRARHLDRGKWVSPCLAPAINSLIANVIDFLFVVHFGPKLRSPHLCRILWDGAIAVGCAVGGSFVAWFASDDVSRSKPDSTPETAAVGAMLAVLTIFLAFLHLGIAITGHIEIRRDPMRGQCSRPRGAGAC